MEKEKDNIVEVDRDKLNELSNTLEKIDNKVEYIRLSFNGLEIENKKKEAILNEYIGALREDVCELGKLIKSF